jgi:hypothetical protein
VINFIMRNQDGFGADFEVIHAGAHGSPAEIDISRGNKQVAREFAIVYQRMHAMIFCFASEADFGVSRECFDKPRAGIVPRFRIFLSGVGQANNQLDTG